MQRRILSLGRRDDFSGQPRLLLGLSHFGGVVFLRGKETKGILHLRCGATFDENVGAAVPSGDLAS